MSTFLGLLLMASAGGSAEEACFAQCSGGLTDTGDRGPVAGEAAPTFTAVLFDPATGVAQPRTLHQLLDQRPLILAFGSFT